MGWKEDAVEWKNKNLSIKKNKIKEDPKQEHALKAEPDPEMNENVEVSSAREERVESQSHTSAPTAPWASSSSPWKRDTLKLSGKRAGFRPRWVSEINFERNLEYGWVFARRENYGGGTYDKIAGEESNIDSRVRRRGMVLMEIPEELAKQREKHYSDRANEEERSIKERHKKDAVESGVRIYDPIG